MKSYDRWLYQQYRRNLHRPERPTRPRKDAIGAWVATPLRIAAWWLNRRSH